MILIEILELVEQKIKPKIMIHTFMQENEIEIRSENDILWCDYISAVALVLHMQEKSKKKKREREFLCSHWCFIVHKFTDKTLSWKLKWRRTEGGETEVQNREFKVKGPFGWEDEKVGG